MAAINWQLKMKLKIKNVSDNKNWHKKINVGTKNYDFKLKY